jgi:hypothetical protein
MVIFDGQQPFESFYLKHFNSLQDLQNCTECFKNLSIYSSSIYYQTSQFDTGSFKRILTQDDTWLDDTFWKNGGNYMKTPFSLGTLNSNPISFIVSGSEKMLITSNNGIGINMSPSYSLDINGTLRVYRSSLYVTSLGSYGGIIDYTRFLSVNGSTGINGQFLKRTFSSNEWNNILTSDVSGLNAYTSSVNTSLTSLNSFSSSINSLTGSYFTQGGNSFGTTAILGTNDNNSLIFETSGSSKMFISSSGFIGIGTTTPNAKLDVNVTSTGTPQGIAITNTNNVEGGVLGIDFIPRNTLINGYSSIRATAGFFGTDADLRFHTSVGGVQTEKMIIDGNGNVGIGTSFPNSKLTIAGGINVENEGIYFNSRLFAQTSGSFTILYDMNASSGGSHANIYMGNGIEVNYYNNSNHVFRNRNGSSIALQIFSNGNVGINTDSTDTGEKLQVNGTSRFIGNIISNGGGGIQSNTAFGQGSLSSNTTGNSNTALGYNSLASNIIGSANTAYGFLSLGSNTTGNFNVAIGTFALQANTSGSGNTAVGQDTLYGNTTGVGNTVLGCATLSNNTSGNYNVAIGYNTGLGITTGGSNTIIGSNVTGLSATLSNNIIISDGNGNRRINVDNTGNIGIGTTAPTSKLHIEGDNSSTTDETVLILRGNGENGKRIDFKNAFGSLARITGTKLAAGASADEGILTFETSTNSILSEKMRITDLGNVGIGTTAPVYKLDVNGNVNTTGAIYFNSRLFAYTSGNYSILFDMNAASGTAHANIYMGNGDESNYYDNTAHRFRNRAGASTRLEIFSNGNVGIGTTTDAGYKLDVIGDIRATRIEIPSTTAMTLTNNGNQDFHSSGASAKIRFIDSGYANENLTIDQSGNTYIRGNLGVGTISTYKAHIYGAGEAISGGITNAGAKGASLYIQDSGGAAYNGGAVVFGATQGVGAAIKYEITDGTANSKGDLSFQIRPNTSDTSLTTALQIKSTGNVGIGTTSTSAKLNVTTTGTAGAIFTTADYGLIDLTNGTSTLRLQNNNSIPRLSTVGAYPLVFAPNEVEQMRITSGGNVGIGTSSPRGKLDVTTIFVSAGTANDSIVFGSGTITYPTAPYGGYGGLVSKGLISDARLMMQDGNGRINNYWNAYSDAGGYKYIVSSEPAAREQISVSTNGFWSFYGAPSGTSGSAITFTQGAYIEPNLSVWFSPRGTSSDFYINNSGNIGIGTTSPSSRLTISGGSLATTGNGLHFASELTNGRTGTYDTSSLSSIHTYFDAKTVELTAGSTSGCVTGISATGLGSTLFSGTLRFITASTERMRIFSNGRVGIGTITDAGYLLDVNGTAKIGNLLFSNTNINDNTLSGSNLSIGSQKTGNGDIYLDYPSTGNLYIRKSGAVAFAVFNSSSNFGIGTTSPNAKLDVAGNVFASGNNPIIGGTTGVGIGTSGGYPEISLRDNAGATDTKTWDTYAAGAIMYSRVINDANNSAQVWQQVQRSGATVSSVSFPNGSVGIGTPTPAASAVLDITSTTQGVLFPRLTTTQVNAIVSPANGLTVYNTTLSVLCFYDGTAWKKLSHSNM